MGETSSNPQVLLQMLMPIVRPDGIAPSRRAQNLPLEQQNFEQLLESYGQTSPASSGDVSQTQDMEDEAQRSQMLSQLGGMNRIENATLRDMLSRHTHVSDSNTQRD